MILTKLQEALAEVGSQRAALNEVEAQLRSMIASLSGTPIIAHPASSVVQPPASSFAGRERSRDKLDDIVDILRAEGKPLHITVIAERLSAATGKKLLRTNIEPGLNRHVSRTQRRRIDKFGPSIYGLAEWKPQRQPIAEIAKAS
jgi:hypothetical protein